MTVRWVSSLSIIVFAVVFSAGARAADPGGHTRAAQELVEVMHVERSVKDALDIMIKAQLQANPDLSQFEDLLRAFFAKYMGWDALRDDYAQLYADTFSEPEIKQLVTFYRTPVGQKLIGSLPEIMRKSAELGQAKVGEHLEELKSQVTKRVQETQTTKETP